MAETTVITTIELTKVMPLALDEEYAEEYKRSLLEFFKAHFPAIDDTHIKVQLFVNDETEDKSRNVM